MTGYRIAPLAQSDLDGIFNEVVQYRPRAADRLMERIEKRFALLAAHPLLGESRDDLRTGLRAFSVGNYVIYYRCIEDVVEVVRVLHAARDIDTLF